MSRRDNAMWAIKRFADVEGLDSYTTVESGMPAPYLGQVEIIATAPNGTKWGIRYEPEQSA